MVNIAGLAALATTFLEKYVGFWAAYLPPICIMALGFIPLLVFRTRYGKSLALICRTLQYLIILLVRSAPSGTVLIKAVRALWLAVRHGFRMDAAMPKHQIERHSKHVPWDTRFIEELKLGLFACRIL